jgi:hypothetical protein
MKKICAYCGQDTYHVDIEYLVGYNHLSCALAAEQKAEQMQIINWKKIQGERFELMGASFCFGRVYENSQAYFTEIIETADNDIVFRVKLTKMVGEFNLEIEDTKNILSSKIRRIIRPNEIKSLQNFIHIACDSINKNQVIKTYCSLLGMMQDEIRSKRKAKTISGNTNFNMPVSQSIKW